MQPHLRAAQRDGTAQRGRLQDAGRLLQRSQNLRMYQAVSQSIFIGWFSNVVHWKAELLSILNLVSDPLHHARFGRERAKRGRAESLILESF